MSDRTAYSPPLSQLFCLTKPQGGIWPNYLEAGIKAEHIPELARMATDPDLLWAEIDTPESWAPVHAWRALGQLRAAGAVGPLVGLLDHAENDDWILQDLPTVFDLIGPASLGPLTDYLTDESRGLFGRTSAAEALQRIAQSDPAYRTGVVATLDSVLTRFGSNDPLLNSLVMGNLVDLEAVESAPLMAAAFKSERVDVRHLGDWEDVQIELGLLTQRLTPSIFKLPNPSGPPRSEMRQVPENQTLSNARAKARSKRKNARKARNRNRHK